MPFDSRSLSFPRREIRDDHDLAPDERLRRIRLGDARDDLALFVAQVNLQAQQLVRALHLLRNLDLCDAQFDLREIVDRDLRDLCFGGRIL